MIRRRVVVSGQVQGVGFRYHTREQASALGISGSVANDPDGTVVVDAEGDADSVGRLIDWLRTGPEWAGVESVAVIEDEPVGTAGFEISA